MTIKLNLLLYEPGKEPRNVVSDVSYGDKLIVGRGHSVQIWVNDKNISREHCQILCEDDKLLIEDLNSKNGTFVNGERVAKQVALNNNDEIRLASSSLLKVGLEKRNVAKVRKSTSPAGIPPIMPEPMPTKKLDEEQIRNAVGQKMFIPKGEFSLIDKTFNGYRVEARIGAGGMAVVYKGMHIALHKLVAIKTLAHRLIQNPKAVKRFLNVAKVSGQLSHPNIVQIYDSGSLDDYGIYYIVMEYVEGESLNNLLKDHGKMSVEQSCKIIGYIAGCLNYANKKNIIHRDINPSNVLVGREGVPKLIGLGLAKCLDDDITSLTQPGKGMGMVGYIAPEQLLDASKADHRSDIYSLGAMFYRCLCGQTPYDTKNMREYFNCIHNKIPPIPPYELNSEIPRAISDIILKALSYDPEQRYQNAEDLLMEIKTYLAPQGNEEGIEKARKQIQAMLPSRTSIPGFEFESIYKPVAAIGGDFYDFIELNENDLGIVIGDITGHGLEAAVVVGMVKIALKIMARREPDTAKALSMANREIYPELDATTFATIFYGIIERDTRELRFSRAGHNPLIIYNPARDPKLQTYDPKGMVLGMFSRCNCEELSISLMSGDCLIQYTDGITEAMNSEREEFGMERLCETILKTGKPDLRKILTDIDEAVSRFIGAEDCQDDVTIIGIKVL